MIAYEAREEMKREFEEAEIFKYNIRGATYSRLTPLPPLLKLAWAPLLGRIRSGLAIA